MNRSANTHTSDHQISAQEGFYVLFDPREQINGNPSGDGESLYAFMSRATGPAWQRVRDILSNWVSDYPDEDRPALISRFQRTDRRGFLGAFWELYLHELFRRLGFAIELHPSLNGVSRHPDFRLRHGNEVIYVEAVTIYEPSAHSVEDARLASVRDTLKRIESPNFVISVNARQIAKSKLSLEQIAQELGAWLEEIENTSTATAHQAPNSTFKWREEGWVLNFNAVPKSICAEVTAGRQDAGVSATNGQFNGDSRVIRQRLGEKTRAYGRNLDSPFLIALTSYRPNHSAEAVLTSLFGSSGTRRDLIGASSRETASPISTSGFWNAGSEPKHQDVSAVLTAFELMPWTIARHQPWVIENPWADHPLEIELPFSRLDLNTASGEVTAVETGFQPHQHFGLPMDWPLNITVSRWRDMAQHS